MTGAYHADASLQGKLRRRWSRVAHRRPAGRPPQAMVTFSFDDAPQSAVTAGSMLLEKHGLKGTYYISAGLAETESPMGLMADLSSVQALAVNGHEIACHTLNHIDCGISDPGRIIDDVAANHAAFALAGLPAPVSFAYPYGDVSPGAKRVLGGQFASLRGLHHGVIEHGSDLNQAPAVGIEGPDGEAIALRWLEVAKTRAAWLILYTHDVRNSPSPFGCTPAVLETLIVRAKALGLEVVTAAQGAERLWGHRSGDLARPA